MPGRFFAVSHDLRHHLVGEGIPTAKLEVNHNGIDPGAVTTVQARNEIRNELDFTETIGSSALSRGSIR